MSITVAVPLHASAPWCASIESNVRSLPREVTEIVISDRTCLDDAAERLRHRLADDPRVTVIAEARGLLWHEHCQLLIDGAAGDFAMLMPHDDIFDPSWVPVLQQALVDHPRALLAYGRVEPYEADGVTRHGKWPPLQTPARGEISGWDAVRMMIDDQMGGPFRGLFRRREVLAEGVRLLPPESFPGPGYRGVDQCWAFAMAARAAIVFDDRTVCRKRMHPASFTASTPMSRPGQRQRAAIAVMRRHGRRDLEAQLMVARLRLSQWQAATRWAAGQVQRRLKRSYTSSK